MPKAYMKQETIDLTGRNLWGAIRNTWLFMSHQVRAVKPYDGDELIIEADMPKQTVTEFERCTAFALHRKRDYGRDQSIYDLDDVMALFTGMEITNEVDGLSTGWHRLTIRLYRQHVAFLEPMEEHNA